MTTDIDNQLFFTQAHVTVRAADSAPLLAVAKKRALDPTIFEEFPPFFWQSEISSDRLDAYYTVMDPATTLANYAADAEAGVAVLIGHDSRAAPTGYSLTGALESGAVARVLSDAYALSDPHTAPILNRLRAGVIRDVSVGFSARGAQCVCSICGLDMWRSWDCWHIPGIEYDVETGKKASKGGTGTRTTTLCTGLIVGAHLSEYSLVYDGATPGAAVLQAQRCAESGRLSAGQARVIEQRYRMALPGKRLQTNGYSKEISMAKELETDRDAAEVVPLERTLKPIVERVAPKGSTIEQGVEWMATELGRLAPLAKDGETYRADLVTAGVTEAVRAFGAEKGELKRTMLERSDLDTIKEYTSSWRDIGDSKLPGGRLTTNDGPGDDKPATRAKVRIPGGSRA